jgi:membrane associated rhomboid family serine protease
MRCGSRKRVFYSSVRKPVWVLFLVWVGLQGMGVIQQVNGVSAVSAAAHIGGALVGVLSWAGEDWYNRFRTY